MKIQKNAMRAGIIAALLGLVVTFMWPQIQALLGGLVTPEVKNLAIWVSLIGLVGAMGYANLGVIPLNSIVRLVGYLIGMLGLMVTLLADRNSGNIFLEVFLIYTTVRSLFLGQELQPVKTNWKKFAIGTAKLGFFILLGVLAATNWPVDSKTELQGAYWPWIALSGGILISAAIFLLDNGFFSTAKKFASFYMIGNVFLVVSYLGEYNFVGIVINVTMLLLLLYVAFVEPKHTKKRA